MHIGLIVGIGPAATDYYYRTLISALARVGKGLTLTMAHADAPTLLRHQAEGNIDAFKAKSPVLVIDLLDVVKAELKQRGARKVGLIGTRVVMESRFYGVLESQSSEKYS
jgi:aspartate racemase